MSTSPKTTTQTKQAEQPPFITGQLSGLVTPLDHAQAYAAAGLCCIPVKTDSSKAPALKQWTGYQKKRPTEAEIRAFFSGHSAGIAIIGGAISGNAECLDIDAPELLAEFFDLVDEHAPGLQERLVIVETPRGGRHLVYRCDTIGGSKKLALREQELGNITDDEAKRLKAHKRESDGQWCKKKTLIETKGEGGYFLAPGSPAQCHPTGREYRFLQGSFTALPTITPEERDILLECARSFAEHLEPKQHVTPDRQLQVSGLRPGDEFNQRGNVRALLEKHGWRHLRQSPKGELWQRPDGDRASATLFESGVFYVFSTNAAPFEHDRAYSPFVVFATLEHGGDFQAAAKALAAQGFGEPMVATLKPSSTTSTAPSPTAGTGWQAPKPLPEGLRVVPQLPEALIPAPMRPWLVDIAERLQVPLEYPAAASIVALASVIGSQIRLRPKRRDDWAVTPNLWGAIVGPPSSMKSPAIAESLRPLYRLVYDAEQDYKGRLKEFELTKEKVEIRKLKRREEMKKAAKQKGALDNYQSEPIEEAEEPFERRYIVNDATVEKYGELLGQSPYGLLYFRDELTGWLRSLDDERRANDRAFFLEAWNGGRPYSYDRIGRGSLKIDDITTSVFGGIQPSPLAVYLRAALDFGGDDGLLQRFQMAVYPDPPKDWRNIDRWPETAARNKAFEVFSACSNLAAVLTDSQADEDGKPFLRFDDEAQEFFSEWHVDLMRTLRARDFAHPLLESHFGKYPKLMPSLALIFHLSDVVTGQASGAVSLDAAERAAAWVEFLWEHAQRIYGLVIEADSANARTLARRLQKGDLDDGFTARELRRKGWSGLDSVELLKEPLDLLEDYGWLRAEDVQNAAGGRPTTLYKINPRIQEVRL